MKEIKVLITTGDGDSFLDTVNEQTLERLRVQKEMLQEIGEGGAYPMMETSKGEYVIVKEIVPM